MFLKRRIVFVGIILAVASGAVAGLWAAELDLEKYPSLKPAFDEMRSQLQLTDTQTATAKGLIGEQLERASVVVDQLDEFSFDSVVDLLIEARSIRDDFIPELQSILDAEQKEKLKQLPSSHDLYISAMAGWFTEGRVEKLTKRLGLDASQIPEVRDALYDQFDDSLRIVSGLVDFEGEPKDLIMDSIVDLRMAQRQSNRSIERLLDDDQKAKFEKMND